MATEIDIAVTTTTYDVTIVAEPNEYIINITTGGSGGSQTLAQTLALGNQTGGENIVINNADAIQLENTSLLKKGTYNFGGNGGISRICSNNYEDMWQNGFRHVFDQSGFIRHSTNCFDIVPDSSFDVTLRFKVDSLWTLDNGTTYKCTDATEGAAVWEIYGTNVPTLQQVTDEGNVTSNDLIVRNPDDALKQVVIHRPDAGDDTAYILAQYDADTAVIIGTSNGQASINGQVFNEVQNDTFELTPFYLAVSNQLNFLTFQNGILSVGKVSGFPSIQLMSSVFNLLLKTDLITANRTQQYPDKDGTFAMLDDIPSNGLPSGGTAGQILTKVDATDYNATWQENYSDWTSVVKHTVKNNGDGLISKGTAVYVTGSNGTNMLVGKASNASEATSSKTMGLMQSDITTTGGTQTGFVVTEGLLSGLNTAGQTAGDPVWLGVNGALIYGLANKPYAPAHLVFIGIVTKVSAGNGEIFVKVQNGFELKEIHDVDLVSNAPTNGQGLIYESATSLWKNKTIIEDAIVNGVTDKAPSQNAVFDALALKQNSSTLIFDSLQKAIMRDNYFWFVPAAITLGAGGYNFGTSERISGSTFTYLNNGTLVRGMLSFNTTATAGILAFSRRNDALVLTGLEIVFTRKIQFNSNVSGQRFFSGISKGNQFAAPTNVEPNTLTDIVGVCQLSTSTNMHVVHNDASGTATTIDLGSSYPCNDSQYNYYITIEQTTTSYIVSVERVTIATGVSISTTNTLTTNIPNYATGVIQLLTWISNNASAAIASYLDGGAIGNVKNQ